MGKMVDTANIVSVADISSQSGFSVARVNGIVARITPLRPVAKGQTGLYDIQDVKRLVRKDFAQLLDFIGSSPVVQDDQDGDALAVDA